MNDHDLKDLLAAVDQLHRRWKQVRFVIGLTRLMAFEAIVLVAAGIIDYYTDLSMVARYTLSTTVYTLIATAFAIFILKPLIRPLPAIKLAWLIEKRRPELRELLVTTLALINSDASHLSKDIIDQVVSDCRQKVCALDPRKVFPLTIQEVWGELGVLAVFFIAMSLPPLQLPDLTLRVLAPSEYQPGIGAFHLAFKHRGNDVLTEGSSRTFLVGTNNPELEAITLYFRFPDGRIEQETLTRTDATEPFRHTVSNLYDTVEYWARSGSVSTGIQQITIRKRPKIESFFIRHQPPPHTGLPPIEYESTTGDLKALANTNIELTVTASKPLSAIQVDFDGTRIPVELSANRRKGHCRFLVDHTGYYTVTLRDASGLGNPGSMKFSVTMLPDTAPVVTLVEPEAEVFADSQGVVSLRWKAADDFSVSRQEIHCRSVSGSVETIPIPPDISDYDLELRQLGVAPGDELEVSIHAWDAVRQEGRSETCRVAVLETAGFNEANTFRSILEDVGREFDEAQLRLKDIESSIQEVTLGQGSNIKQSADLSHHLVMLNHRVKRLDQQFLRILSYLPALENSAFFPYSHTTLQLVKDALSFQLIFGDYHHPDSIKRIRRGHQVCRSLLTQCQRAITLLHDYANRLVIDQIGRMTVDGLSSGRFVLTDKTRLQEFYKAKVSLFTAISPDKPDALLTVGNSMDALNRDLVIARLNTFLQTNAKAMQDYSAIKKDVGLLKNAPANLLRALQQYSGRYPREAGTDDWTPSKRFARIITAPKRRSATQVADATLLTDFLQNAASGPSIEQFSLAVEAWHHMRRFDASERWVQHGRGAINQFDRVSLDLPELGEMPLGTFISRHPERWKTLNDQMLLWLTTPWHFQLTTAEDKVLARHIDTLRKMLADAPAATYKFTKLESQCRKMLDAGEQVNSTDMTWRSLMRKALRNRLPSQSQALQTFSARLKVIRQSLGDMEPSLQFELEDIIRDLTLLAEKIEATATDDVLREGGTLSTVQLRLTVAYAIYQVNSDDLQVINSQFKRLDADNDSRNMTFQTEVLDYKLGEAIQTLTKLTAMLEALEAYSRGHVSLPDFIEAQAMSATMADRVLSTELNRHLTLTAHFSSVMERVSRVNAVITGSAGDAAESDQLMQHCRTMADGSLYVLESLYPGSARVVAREFALQALWEWEEVARSLKSASTPDQFSRITKKANLAGQNLKTAESIYSMLYSPGEQGAILSDKQVFTQLELAAKTGNVPAAKKVDGMLKEVISATADLADTLLFTPAPSIQVPEQPSHIMPSEHLLPIITDITSILHNLIALTTHKAGLDQLNSDIQVKRQALRNALAALKKSHAKNSQLKTAISTLQKGFEKRTATTLIQDLKQLSKKQALTDENRALLAPLFNSGIADLEKKESVLKRTYSRHATDVTKHLDQLRTRLTPYSTAPYGGFCIAILDHLEDNLALKNMAAALKNIRRLRDSLVHDLPPHQPVPLSKTQAAAPPADVVDLKRLENPFAIRAAVEMLQDNRLSSEEKADIFQLLVQGDYLSAVRMLPAANAKTVIQAQTGEQLIPMDLAPAIFNGEDVILAPVKNYLTPEEFSVLANILLMGNMRSVKEYLNGKVDDSLISLETFNSTLPESTSRQLDSMIIRIKRLSDSPPAISTGHSLPKPAGDLALFLKNLRLEHYTSNVSDILVAYLENYRAQTYLNTHHYREAANAVYALISILPNFPVDQLEATLIALVDLDAERFPTENEELRSLLRQANITATPILQSISRGDLPGASLRAAALGMNDVSEQLNTVWRSLIAGLSPGDQRALTHLQSSLKRLDDTPTLELVQARNHIVMGQRALAIRLLSQHMEGYTRYHQQIEALLADIIFHQKSIEVIKHALDDARQQRLPAARYKLHRLPGATEAKAMLDQASASVENGLRSALEGAQAAQSFGAQRSLISAFQLGGEFDLNGAISAAKRAEAAGVPAVRQFSKAQESLSDAVSSLERTLSSLESDGNATIRERLTKLVTQVDNFQEREKFDYYLQRNMFRRALGPFRSQYDRYGPYRALTELQTVDPGDKAGQLDVFKAPPLLEINYLVRGVTSLHDVSSEPITWNSTIILEDAHTYIDNALKRLTAQGGELINAQSKKRVKQLSQQVPMQLSENRRAWLKRLETRDFTGLTSQTMSLRNSFFRGGKQNYSNYFKDANRLYLRWLADKSRGAPEKEPTP